MTRYSKQMIYIKNFQSKFHFSCLFVIETLQNHLHFKTTKRTDELIVTVNLNKNGVKDFLKNKVFISIDFSTQSNPTFPLPSIMLILKLFHFHFLFLTSFL